MDPRLPGPRRRGSSPLLLRALDVDHIDPAGQTFFSAHQRADIAARAEQAFDMALLGMRLAMDDDGVTTALAKVQKRRAAQERAELLESNALLVIDLNEKKVTFGGPYGPRKEWPIGKSSGADDPGGGAGALDDARGKDGGPDNGRGPLPGSSTVNVPDDSGSFTSQGDDADSSSGGDVGARSSASQGAGGLVTDTRSDD